MQRLGYDRYGAAGNDWGCDISLELGRIAPDSVVGVHVTQIFRFLSAILRSSSRCLKMT